MENFDIITKDYFSNCFIEALRAKHTKIYFCKPRITENGNFQKFHFMWSDGAFDYDFSDAKECEIPWYGVLIYKGHVRRFRSGFAERYCKYRNTKRKN